MKKGLLVLIFLLLVALSFGWVFHRNQSGVGSAKTAKIDKGVCTVLTKKAGRKLLEPLYPNRTPLSFETGPDCNIIGRVVHGSIVLALSPRGPDPLPLKVAAMPEDEVTLAPGNVLMINGQNYKNSAGRDYRLNRMTQRKNIDKIKKEYEGKVPEGFYFLMGDNDKGFLDSSNFGLIAEDKILGILPPEE
ncbi:MAG: signal peptidase I [Alphaproteobacteria bacterium]|nr:signal peptidase I [Alphaproteobacteria bacterium]